MSACLLTLTCIAVKDHKTVSYTERDRDAHTVSLRLDASVYISLHFSLKKRLPLLILQIENSVFVCVSLKVYSRMKATSHFSFKRWPHNNKKKWKRYKSKSIEFLIIQPCQEEIFFESSEYSIILKEFPCCL